MLSRHKPGIRVILASISTGAKRAVILTNNGKPPEEAAEQFCLSRTNAETTFSRATANR
jgi:hypothetical protein